MNESLRIIEDNRDVALAIQRIQDKADLIEIEQLLKELESTLFRNYCEKGYLDTCEPEFCSFRITNECRYVKLLSYIQNTYGIWARGNI